MQTHAGEIVEELLDPRLVRHRREGVRPAGRIPWVLSADAVHLVEILGLRVVGLEVVVADRPRGRDPAVVLQLAEVRLPQPVQRRSVELRRSAHEVVDLGLEGFPLLVVPGVLRDVSVVDEDGGGVPILGLSGQPVPAFEDQHSLSRGRQAVGERASAGPGSHDDDVVLVGHECLLRWFRCQAPMSVAW